MRLGITRSSEQIAALRERARERGVEVVSLPVVSVQPVAFEWPAGCAPEQVDWLVFTSAQGVEMFFSRLKNLHLRVGPRTRIATVGRKTAEALEQYGHRSDFSPCKPYGERLFTELVEWKTTSGSTVVYARGRVTNYDPAELLARASMRYFPVTCYETVTQPIDRDLVERFGSSDSMLFTAPSTVASFMSQFGTPTARLLAIGRSTAEEMARVGWAQVTILPRPDVDSVLEYL